MSSCLYRGIEGSGQSRMRIAVLENENDTQEGGGGTERGGDLRSGRVVSGEASGRRTQCR